MVPILSEWQIVQSFVQCFHVFYGLSIVCSVPQGYLAYTADLAEVIEKHDVALHAFADNTQLLYLHCRRDDNRRPLYDLHVAL